MEQTIIEALAASGGAAAILAGLIFLMYRRDKEASEKRISDICQAQENRLREDRVQMVSMIERDQTTREDQTRALQELTTMLQRMNGRH